MIDPSTFHQDLKRYRFRAVNTVNTETRKIVCWRLLLKPRGRGHKWRFAGSDDGHYLFSSEQEAREAAMACNHWASE